jgi:uncharacterized delta-60 repeat protein
MTTSRLFLFAVLGIACAQAAPTARLASEWFAPLDSAPAKFALIDTESGTLRVGVMDANGQVSWPHTVPTGINAVSDAASGFSISGAEHVLLTSPGSNRVARVALDAAAPFGETLSPVLGIGTSGLAETSVLADRQLLISSLINGNAAGNSTRLETLTSAGALFANENIVTALSRLEPLTNPSDGSRIVIGLIRSTSSTQLFRARPFFDTAIATFPGGDFDLISDVRGSAGARHLIAFQPGSASAFIVTASAPVSNASAFTSVAATLPFAVNALITVSGGGTSPLTDGFLAIADDGTQATWLRVNATGDGFITTTHNFTPSSGLGLNGILPTPSGIVQLLGDPNGGPSTDFRGMTFDGTNWNATNSGSLPSLNPTTQLAATLLFYDKNPATDSTARLLGMQQAPDWTKRMDVNDPKPLAVIREAYASATSGLRFTTTQTLTFPTGTNFVVTNQADALLSHSALGNAASFFTPSLRILPNSGTYNRTQLVTATFDDSTYRLRFRVNAEKAVWKDFPSVLPVAFSTSLQFTLQHRLTGALGPIQTRSYEINTGALASQDSDGDEVPDYVEQHFGTNPFDGADSDGDGVSDLDEILAGTKPADASSRPNLGTAGPILRGTGLRLVTDARDHASLRMVNGETMAAHTLAGELIAQAQRGSFSPFLPNDGATAGVKLESGVAITPGEIIALSTALEFRTPNVTGREIIAFLNPPSPPRLQVNFTPRGVSLSDDALGWKNAAVAASFNPFIDGPTIPFATSRTTIEPVDTAVSILLEDLVHQALLRVRPSGTPTLDKFSAFSARGADASRTKLGDSDKQLLITKGFDFRKALTLAQGIRGNSNVVALANAAYQRHVTQPDAVLFTMPLDALRSLLRGTTVPVGYESLIATGTASAARTAYTNAAAQSAGNFRPQENFRITVPEVSLGDGVYVRDPAGAATSIVFIRFGERFQIDQGLGVRPGAQFDVTAFTDLPADNGIPAVEPTSITFVSSPTDPDRDTDSNGLDDEWERFFFGAIGQDPNSVPQGQTRTLLQLFTSGDDPRPVNGVPAIAIEQPLNTPVASGGTVNYGVLGVGSARPLVFAARNPGTGNLSNLSLSLSLEGTDASSFAVTVNPVSPVAPLAFTTFTVQFASTTSGTKNALLRVASNVPSGTTYDINLTGTAVTVGQPNPTFDPNITFSNPGVVALAVQPNGQILVGGTFTTVGGQTRTNLARLNASGTLDTSFAPAVNARVNCIAVQPDGQILIGGDFTTVNSATHNRLARLNPDGTLDPAFNAGTGAGSTVNSIAMQQDGRLIVAGNFISFAGQTRTRIVRLTSTGGLDGSFNTSASADAAINTAIVQPDGKILIGGSFLNVNGTARSRVARLNTDGTLEGTSTFAIGAGFSNTVQCMNLQSDGRILVGGLFATVQGTARQGIARLNSNGTLDTSLSSSVSTVASIARQTDQKIFIAGGFTSVGGQIRNRIARLNADGTLDSSFNIGTGASTNVNAIAQAANGSVFLGGVFTSFNGIARSGIVQLVNAAPVASITAPDRTQIAWSRSGTAPEITDATIDLSTDGGTTFTRLGTSTFVTGGWSLTSLNLPGSGIIRTRGNTRSGQGNSSTGWVEATAAFNINSVTLPTITDIADVTMDEDSTSAPIAFTIADPDTAASALIVAASSSNTALVPNSAIGLSGGGADRTLTLTPLPNKSGTATISVSVFDGFNTVSESFQLTVNGVNDAPTITAIPAQTLALNIATAALPFNVADLETAAASLTVSAASSNTTLVPLNRITFAGTGANRTVSVAPAIGQVGSSTITVTVSDGNASAATSFAVTVTNTAPTISAIGKVNLAEDSASSAIPFTIGDAETPSALTVTVESSDTTLLPVASIGLDGTGTARTVTVTPAANRFGTALVTLTVSDGLLTRTSAFQVNVTPVNDLPSISDIADLTIAEDQSTAALPFSVTDVDLADTLTVTATSSNTGLINSDGIALSTSPRSITLTPLPDANGTSTLTLTVSDGTVTRSDTFVLTVAPVNDAPSFTKGPDRSHPAGFTAAQTVSAWATNLSVGPANEAAQTLSFTITANSNPGLFTTQPAIAPDGTLTYRTAGTPGSASISLVINDSAGGSSAAQTFVIQVASQVPDIGVIDDDRELTDGSSSLALPSAGPGRSSNASVLVRNAGTGQLNVTGATIDGPDAARFSVASVAASALVPSGLLPVRITFRPLETRTHTATLHILSDDPDASERSFDIALTGSGAALPVVKLLPPADITDESATLSAEVTAGDSPTSCTFAFSLTGTGERRTVSAEPASVSGTTPAPVTAKLTGLRSNTFYFFSLRVENAAGVTTTEGVFTTSKNAPGSQDTRYRPAISGPLAALAVATGDTLFAGGTSLLRLDAKGGIDPTFTPALSPGGSISCIAAPDSTDTTGRVLVGGNFQFINGFTQPLLASVNAVTGALDTSFHPAVTGTAVHRIVRDDSGDWLIAGDFTAVNASSRNSLARLHADGSLDPTFGPALTGPAPVQIRALAVQDDGRILIAGTFTSVTGIARQGIARLNSDGTLDTSFAPTTDGRVNVILARAEGGVLIGGDFTQVNGRAAPMIAALRSDGTSDTSFVFNPVGLTSTLGDASINHMLAQANGRILIAGDFSWSEPTRVNSIARLHADGSQDLNFTTGIDGSVDALAMQSDGRLLVSGVFALNSGVLPSLARLENNPAEQSLQVEGGTVRLLRGGSLPEASSLRLAISTTEPFAFTDLGPATRIPGGWTLAAPELNQPFFHLAATAESVSGASAGSLSNTRTIIAHGQPDLQLTRLEGLELKVITGSQTESLGSAPLDESFAHTFTITNLGSLPLTLGPITIDGANASDFRATLASPTTLIPGAQTNLTVTFQPSALGDRTARLRIGTNDPGFASTGTFDLSLTATGIARTVPDIEVLSPSSTVLFDNGPPVDLGIVTLGTAKEFTFVIRNKGGLNLTNFTFSSKGSTDFILDGGTPGTVRHGEAILMTVRFNPTAVGQRTAVLSIGSNDPDENTFDIPVTATGVTRIMDVTQANARPLSRGDTLFFGVSVPGDFQNLTLEVRNAGTAPLNLSRVRISGDTFTLLSVSKTVVAPGRVDFAIITIQYRPVSGGTSVGTVDILSDATKRNPSIIRLQGLLAQPEISITGQSTSTSPNPFGELTSGLSVVDFGPCPVNGQIDLSFLISNLNKVPSTPPLTFGPADFSDFSTNGLAFSVATGRLPVATPKFLFRPTGTGQFSATVSFPNNDANENPFTFRVTGTGVTTEEATPSFITPPVSRIVALGAPVTMEAEATSALPLTYEWFTTSGTAQTIVGREATFRIAATKTTDAKAYQARAINRFNRTTSAPAILTVLEAKPSVQSIPIGQTVSFSVIAHGPATETFRWLKNGSPLPADARFTGANTSRLTISSATLADEGVYACEVTAPGGSLIGGENKLQVFSGGPDISHLDNTDLPVGQVGASYKFEIKSTGVGAGATTYSANGLLGGLTLDRNTGVISGRPGAAVTNLRVTLSATNSRGTSTAQVRLTVIPLPANLAGIYAGVITRHAVNEGKGGRIDLTVTASGSYTGKLTLGTTVLPFGPHNLLIQPGESLVSDSFTVGTKPTVRVDLTFNPLRRDLEGTVTDISTNPIDPSPAAIEGWSLVSLPNEVFALGMSRMLTFALETPLHLMGNDAIPQGYGFGSTTVFNGTIVVAGETADGIAFTSSTVLGAEGQLAVVAASSTRSLVGKLTFHPAFGTLPSGRNIANHTLTGTVSWTRAPATTSTPRLYREGFGPVPLQAIGNSYRVATFSELLTLFNTPPSLFDARISFFEGGIGPSPSPMDIPFSMPLAGSTGNLFNRPEAPLLSLDITTAAGTFKGNATLPEVSAFNPPTHRIVRKFSYKGTFVQRSTEPFGAGYFTLPKLPFLTPAVDGVNKVIVPFSQTSILSGAVLLEPTERP